LARSVRWTIRDGPPSPGPAPAGAPGGRGTGPRASGGRRDLRFPPAKRRSSARTTVPRKPTGPGFRCPTFEGPRNPRGAPKDCGKEKGPTVGSTSGPGWPAFVSLGGRIARAPAGNRALARGSPKPRRGGPNPFERRGLYGLRNDGRGLERALPWHKACDNSRRQGLVRENRPPERTR